MSIWCILNVSRIGRWNGVEEIEFKGTGDNNYDDLQTNEVGSQWIEEKW